LRPLFFPEPWEIKYIVDDFTLTSRWMEPRYDVREYDTSSF